MAFPRAPNKPVRGTLRLVVRSPETEITVGESEDPHKEFSGADDFAEGIDIKLPNWFSVSSDPAEVRTAQRDAALQQIKGLREKRVKCAVCKKRTSERSLDEAEWCVREAEAFFSAHCPDVVTFLVGQLPDGTVTLEFNRRNLILGVQFSAAGFEVGGYANEVLQFSSKHRYSARTKLQERFKWFSGV